jgi:capsular polysaccharide biosynthesis protein
LIVKSSADLVDETAYISSTVAGSSWFGHWLEDELPSLLLGSQLGLPHSFKRKMYPDESAYIAGSHLALPITLETALFRNIWIVDEFAQNPSKVWRFHEIRRRLGAGSRQSYPVYIPRGTTGAQRTAVNDPELPGAFRDLGYEVIIIGETSFEDLKERLRNAAWVVGLEGSHLAHALYFCPPGAMLIVLAPSNHAHTTITELAQFYGLSSALYICKPANDDGSRYRVDLQELQGFIARALRTQAHRALEAERLVAEIFALHAKSPAGQTP